MGLVMACYLGLHGIIVGLTKSTCHPSRAPLKKFGVPLGLVASRCSVGVMRYYSSILRDPRKAPP